MRRAAGLLLVVLAVAPAGATTVPDSRGGWTKAAIPIELRNRAHVSVRDVPPLPEDDPKLAHLENWPKKRRIEGCDCELKVSKWILHSREKPAPDARADITSASYRCRPRWWPWGKPEMRGPASSWTSGGWIRDRGYVHSRTDAVTYQLDQRGRVVGFLDRKHGVIEYFDTDGVLVGGEYAPLRLDWSAEGYRGGTVSVWLGERITHEEFLRRRADRLMDAGWPY